LKLTSREGAERKSMIKRKTQEMIEEGVKLKEDQKEATVVDGWWAKFKEKRRVNGKLNRYKFAVLTLERDFQIFKLELEYMNTNPIIWFLKLIIGSIFIVISFIWWLHM
jgi:LMBR1 domain-containing protein 1